MSTSSTPALQLLEIVGCISSAKTIDEVTDLIRRSARRLIGADGVALILKDGDLCHYVEEDAVGPLWKGKKFPAVSCVSGWAISNRKTAIIPDIYADSRVPHALYRETFVRSMVMVPVGVNNPIGAIGAYWSETYEPSTEDIETIEALARAAGSAIEQAQLVASLSRALTEAELSRDELRHRVKNAFATSQALAALSLPPDQSGKFITRLSALARAHELLDRQLLQQRAISLQDLLEAELSSYAAGRGHLSIDGPAVLLDSTQGIAVGLAINELATNALKYGSLSTPNGRLSVSWQLEGQYLALDWRESGGPEIRTGILEGFGSRLLKRLVEGQLRGSIVRTLNPRGVDCRIEFPATIVQDERLAQKAG